MSKKIPVGAVIARTYGFAFENFINNLGATWIPQAIVLAADFLLLPRYFNAIGHFVPVAANAQNTAAAQAATMQNLQTLAALGPLFGLLYLVAILCICAMFVGVTKEALGVRTGSSFLQNPFGAATWRFLGAILLFILLMIALYIAFAVAGVTIGMAAVAASSAGAKAALGLVAGLGAIVVGLGFIYVSVRMGFLIAPAVVAEQRVTLATGWRLARGNFWRIVVVWLAIVLPLLLLEIGAFAALMGGHQMPPLRAGASPQEIQAWSQQFTSQLFGSMETVFRRWWFVTFPILVVLNTFLYGLFAGSSAFSYRALAGEKDPTEPFA
jgi:hypothetical protein